MMRYKRYKNRYRSKVVKMKFQSFVDLSTEADTMKIISVSAGGDDVLKRLTPFFSAYKYYKLGNVSIKLIPASTLPVDPTGLSYEVGENTVDPRDQLTPGMCRITNGEDILEDISGLTGDQQRELYNNMLLDPRWFKWMLQTGVKRSGSPRYWQIGQLHQDKWPGSVVNIPNCFIGQVGYPVGGTSADCEYQKGQYEATHVLRPGSSPYGFFQTGHRGKLGWLPTDGLQPLKRLSADGGDIEIPFLASIPEIELFKILLPPVHKTNFYYRMFITQSCYFRDPVVMNINGYAPLDLFHRDTIPGAPLKPTASNSYPDDSLIDKMTGGNNGSD